MSVGLMEGEELKLRYLHVSHMRRIPRVGSGTGHGWIAQAELLKMKKNGQFPDVPDVLVL
jgi:hypothetical protein